ncbi:hypothetical protein Peur_002684 [Populus x canadensis]
MASSPVQKGRGEEANIDCLVSRLLSRQRMNPHAVSGWGAWRRRVATVPVVQKAFPVIPYCFWAIFVILKLFNVLFI